MRFHELFSVGLIDRRNMDVCHFEVESTEGFMNHLRKGMKRCLGTSQGS